MNNIAEIIAAHRKVSGLSQADLASLAGVGKTAVFDIEHGKETVRFSTLTKVLHSLNIELELKSPLMAEILATKPPPKRLLKGTKQR